MKKAFTLVELLVVIAIFVIVAAIAVPSFNALFSGTGQYWSQQQVASMCKLARDKAMELHRDVGVVFYEESQDNIGWPVRSGSTAMALIVEDEGQPPVSAATPTYFKPLSGYSVEYLPTANFVGTLIGTASTGNTSANPFALGPWIPFTIQPVTPRAIVFDGDGHLIIVPSMGALAGDMTTTQDWKDWNFDPTPSDVSAARFNYGPSAGGFIAYRPNEMPSVIMPAEMPIGNYLSKHFDVAVVNTYTGDITTR